METQSFMVCEEERLLQGWHALEQAGQSQTLQVGPRGTAEGLVADHGQGLGCFRDTKNRTQLSFCQFKTV